MKRSYVIVVLVVLIGGLLAAVRWRDGWMNRVMREHRAGRLESATPRWPNLSGGPLANRPVDRHADE